LGADREAVIQNWAMRKEALLPDKAQPENGTF